MLIKCTTHWLPVPSPPYKSHIFWKLYCNLDSKLHFKTSSIIHYQQRCLSNISRMPSNVLVYWQLIRLGDHWSTAKKIDWENIPKCDISILIAWVTLNLGKYALIDDKLMGDERAGKRAEQRVEGIPESLIIPNKHCKAFLTSHLKHILEMRGSSIWFVDGVFSKYDGRSFWTLNLHLIQSGWTNCIS